MLGSFFMKDKMNTLLKQQEMWIKSVFTPIHLINKIID